MNGDGGEFFDYCPSPSRAKEAALAWINPAALRIIEKCLTEKAFSADKVKRERSQWAFYGARRKPRHLKRLLPTILPSA
jgi:hypothetical protein